MLLATRTSSMLTLLLSSLLGAAAQGIGEIVQGDSLVKLARFRDARVPQTGLHTLKNATLRFTQAEATTWLSQLAGARSYLEWGSGGSTVIAAWLAIHGQSSDNQPRLKVQSIEHSGEWVAMLRERNPLAVRRAEAKGLLSFRIPQIGPTGDWGRPTDWQGRDYKLRMKQARSYVEPEGITCCFDVVLIDGRFREVLSLGSVDGSRAARERHVLLVCTLPTWTSLSHPRKHAHLV